MRAKLRPDFTTRRRLIAALVFSCASWNAGPAAAEDDGAPEPSSSTTTVPADAPAPFVGVLAAGSGVGQRYVRVPTRLGAHDIEAGFFPVLDVLLAGEFEASRRTIFGAQAHYQTSVGLSARATPPAGAPQETALRSHHVDFGVIGGMRFGESSASVSARLYAGWAFRGLRSVIDIDVPPFTLHGPWVRPELRVPFGSSGIVLRLSPELFVVSYVTSELRHFGATSGVGLAFGGEAAVEVSLNRRFDLTLEYRESRATLSTAWSEKMKDNERFATVRLALKY